MKLSVKASGYGEASRDRGHDGAQRGHSPWSGLALPGEGLGLGLLGSLRGQHTLECAEGGVSLGWDRHEWDTV